MLNNEVLSPHDHSLSQFFSFLFGVWWSSDIQGLWHWWQGKNNLQGSTRGFAGPNRVIHVRGAERGAYLLFHKFLYFVGKISFFSCQESFFGFVAWPFYSFSLQLTVILQLVTCQMGIICFKLDGNPETWNKIVGFFRAEKCVAAWSTVLQGSSNLQRIWDRDTST